jgi:hypothetical protein
MERGEPLLPNIPGKTTVTPIESGAATKKERTTFVDNLSGVECRG